MRNKLLSFIICTIVFWGVFCVTGSITYAKVIPEDRTFVGLERLPYTPSSTKAPFNAIYPLTVRQDGQPYKYGTRYGEYRLVIYDPYNDTKFTMEPTGEAAGYVAIQYNHMGTATDDTASCLINTFGYVYGANYSPSDFDGDVNVPAWTVEGHKIHGYYLGEDRFVIKLYKSPYVTVPGHYQQGIDDEGDPYTYWVPDQYNCSDSDYFEYNLLTRTWKKLDGNNLPVYKPGYANAGGDVARFDGQYIGYFDGYYRPHFYAPVISKYNVYTRQKNDIEVRTLPLNGGTPEGYAASNYGPPATPRPLYLNEYLRSFTSINSNEWIGTAWDMTYGYSSKFRGFYVGPDLYFGTTGSYYDNNEKIYGKLYNFGGVVSTSYSLKRTTTWDDYNVVQLGWNGNFYICDYSYNTTLKNSYTGKTIAYYRNGYSTNHVSPDVLDRSGIPFSTGAVLTYADDNFYYVKDGNLIRRDFNANTTTILKSNVPAELRDGANFNPMDKVTAMYNRKYFYFYVNENGGSRLYQCKVETGEVEKVKVPVTKVYGQYVEIATPHYDEEGNLFYTYKFEFINTYDTDAPQIALEYSTSPFTENPAMERVISSPPSINITNPATGIRVGNGAFTIIPSIEVSDQDNDTLTCSYYVDAETVPRDTKTIANTATTQAVSFNALDTVSLAEGPHTLRFEVTDVRSSSVSQNVEIYVDKTPPTLGQVSTSSTEISIIVSGSASDASGMDSTPYRYSVGSAVSDWTASTSYTQISLTPNTPYTVTFEARDTAGNIQNSSRTVYTKAAVPAAAVNNNRAASLDISISDGNPANTQYQITTGGFYVTQEGGLTDTSQWITLSGKRITVTGLASNTAHTFQVKARNGENTETASTTTSGITLPNPPTGIQGTPTRTDITLAWDIIHGVTGYEVQVDGDEQHPIDVGPNTTYTHSGLHAETQHTYRVRARNSGGTGEWSAPLILWTLPNPPATPVNIKATPAIPSITLTWDATAGATGYEVEVDRDDKNLKNIPTGTIYIHTGLGADTPHTYRVRAKNAGGASAWSEAISLSTLPNPPETPTQVKAVDIKRDYITLTWDDMARAAGYEIEVDNLLGTIIDNGTSTTYKHEGLIPDTVHTYRVRAKNAGGSSNWSELLTITTLPNPPTTPTNVTANAGNTEVKITWDAVVYATRYEIELDGVQTQSVTDYTYLHSGLKAGEQHTYRIRAINAGGESPWSKPLAVTTLPDSNLSLTNVAAVVTTTSILISWDAVSSNAEYEIEVDGTPMDNGKSTLYSHTGLSPDTFHTYRVKVKTGANAGEWCAMLTLSTLPNPPGAPENITAYATYDRVDIGWEAQTGATGYEIEVDGVIIENNTRTSYTHENLTPGTQHTYRVRAKNLGGTTAWSSVLKISTRTPVFLFSGKQDAVIQVPVIVSNIQDFQGRSFTLTYDPEEAEVLDLCKITPEKEVASGEIKRTGLTVEYAPGSIVFTVDKPLVPGTSWSGVISTVIFKAKKDGQFQFTYTVGANQ